MNDLIYDRKQSDVTNNTLKGQYNWTDLNRVEKWCKYLADELATYNINVNITTKTNWTPTDMRTTTDMIRIKNNIVALCNGFTYITRPYSNVTPWRYSTANRWEQVLNELRQFVEGMENYTVYCGIARSGEPRIWQNRFMQLYDPPAKDYIELPYIQSTGTQYIDTKIRTRNIEKTIIDFEFTGLGEQRFFGQYRSSPYIQIGLNPSNQFVLIYGTQTLTSTKVAEVGVRYTLTAETNNGIQIVTLKEGTTTTTIIQGTLANTTRTTGQYNYLFARNRSAEAERQPAKIKLYSCQLYSYEVLMRDFIPAKNEEDKSCLWDKVSETFFLNIGTGEFLPSEDVGDALLTENGQAITTEVGETIDTESVPYKLRLDYIESTGQQYIDTGIKASSDLRIQAEFELITILDLYYYLFGGRDGSVTNGFSLRYRINDWISEYGDATTVAYNPARSTYTKYIIDKNRNVCSINGTTITSITRTFTSNQNVAIFGLLYENGLQTNPSRLYSFKIYKNDVLVRDYIPVLDNNDVACLYDQVTQEFYYNNGFGEFAPSSTSEFTHVDWLESTGTQYINTGIKTNEISRARGIAINTFGLTYNTYTYGGSLFGARVSTTNSVYQYGTGALNDFIGNGTSQVSLTKNTQTTTISISYGKTSYEVACGSYYASGNLNVTITTPLDFYVCGMNNNGTLSGGTFKVIAVQLMNNNNEISMQLIPCIRKSDNKACFYDLVSHRFFENQGTGDFIIPT